ncbi:MAG TPA: hypothetical protein VM536_08270 [Chloroflexia bacterium]|nr:hypothetical protein [Chloroflexia bacterium]
MNHESMGATMSAGEVKLAFLDALERGERPDGWLQRYPQHAAALLDLAQARDLEAAAPQPSAAEVAAIATIARRTLATAQGTPVLTLSERARQAGLSLRELAGRVGISSDVLVKIDRCVVRPETVPAALLRELAALLDCTAAAVRAGLGGAGPVTAGAYYHAAQAPQVSQQTFAEAVAASVALDPEARARWLALAAEA